MTKKIIISSIVSLLILIIGVTAFIAGFTISKFLTERSLAYNSEEDGFKLLNKTIDIIEDSYVDKVSKKKLFEGAIRGMVESLNDPHSAYLNREDFKNFQEETKGEFFGVGIWVAKENNHILVVSVIEDTPAEKAGIKSNDVIVKVDGKEVKGLSIEAVTARIKGPKGTKVVLSIKRKNVEEELKFKVTRDKIVIPNIKAELLEDQAGYIKINNFNQNTSKETKQEFNRLKKKGAQGIILDLRHNPGGLFEESIDISSIFLRDKVVVSTIDREGNKDVYKSRGKGDEKIPLVVLINKGSASSSEIVAGAIKDNKRGVLVGEKSFGKGSVQSLQPLGKEGAILITIQKYLTPSGKSIHKKGVMPDVEVEMEADSKEDIQLEKAKKILQDLISGKSIKEAA